MGGEVAIGVDRQKARRTATWIVIALSLGVAEQIWKHDLLGAAAIAVLLGLALAFTMWQIVSRSAVLIVDDDGMTSVASHTAVRWEDVDVVRIDVDTGRGIWEAHRELVCVMTVGEMGEGGSTSTRTVVAFVLSLDRLSMEWQDIAAVIEARLGRRVVVRQQSGPIQRVDG